MSTLYKMDQMSTDYDKQGPSTSMAMPRCTVKIWSSDRKLKKAVTCSTFRELIEKTKAKFSLDFNSDLKFVLESDGTEIEEENFNALTFHSTYMLTLIFLMENEEWTSPTTDLQYPGPGKEKSHETEEEQKNSILQFVEKMQAKFEKGKGKGVGKEKHKKSTLRVPIGWLNYSYSERRYIQVKNTVKNQTGTTTILLPRQAGYEETKTCIEEVYFPGGKGCRGKLESMESQLGTYKGNIVNPESFATIHEWVEGEQKHQQKARLYLLTKKKLMQNYDLLTDTHSTDSDDSDFLPQLKFTRSKRKKTTDSDSVMSYTYCHSGAGPSTLISSTSHTPCSLSTATPTTTAAIAVCNPLIDNSSGSQNKNTSTSQQPGQQWLPAGTPTVLFQQGHAGKNCMICFDREISHFFLPCGHTTCLVCGLEIETHNRMCPVCRLLIQEVKPLFM